MRVFACLPASRLPASSMASWWADRSRGNQAEERRERTMLAMPTVRVLLPSSTTLPTPGWDRLGERERERERESVI